MSDRFLFGKGIDTVNTKAKEFISSGYMVGARGHTPQPW